MKRTLALSFVLIAAFTAAAPARAAAIYSYEGLPFFNFPGDPLPPGTYDFGMRLTGSFTVAGPLLSAPYSDISASILSFSFSDGRQTLSSVNSSGEFGIATNAAGVPIDWSIVLRTSFPSPASVGELERIIFTGPVLDFGRISYCTAVNAAGDCTANSSDSGITSPFATGSWTVASTPDPDPVTVPEPASLALLGLGLAGLSLARRRRI